MARLLRIEFPNALYHVTSRGDGRDDIYCVNNDRINFLKVLNQVCERFNWVCHSYCLMTNHYHLLIETPEGNLSQGMRHLNGVYTQRVNRSHNRVGHVFQGRYKAILVDKESYLLELSRYIVLNPVRAGMVNAAKDWSWSSYQSTAGLSVCPAWLKVDGLLLNFSKHKKKAIQKYCAFIAEGYNNSSPWDQLNNQIYLGNDAFVDKMQRKMADAVNLQEVPSSQVRQVAKPLSYYESLSTNRDEVVYLAYQSGGYKMNEIGRYFDLHYSSVSKIIKNIENSRFKT
ncbi:MAG: putative transposase [Pseudohongiellaceae bacterium]|jgi:putative transposase